MKSLIKDPKLRRYAMFSLGANAVGYTAVYLLVSRGVMGTWWANTTVSKGMAPLGLALNTLALTGRVLPTRIQTAKWLAYWVPSALTGAICLAFVVTNFGLESIQARAVAGLMLFPFDYVVKKFVIFAKQVRLTNFISKQKFALVVMGVLIWKKLSLAQSSMKLRLAETA